MDDQVLMLAGRTAASLAEDVMDRRPDAMDEAWLWVNMLAADADGMAVLLSLVATGARAAILFERADRKAA